MAHSLGSELGEAGDAFDSDSEDDNGLGSGVVGEGRFDRCERGEALHQLVDNFASFIRFHFLVSAECQDTFPVNVAFGFINLYARTWIVPQAVDFQSWK